MSTSSIFPELRTESRLDGRIGFFDVGLCHHDGCRFAGSVTMIPKICAKFAEGFEVVNPHRASRQTDTSFKRNTAAFFYRFTNSLEGREILPANVNCFRGLSEGRSMSSWLFPRRTGCWSTRFLWSDSRRARSISKEKKKAGKKQIQHQEDDQLCFRHHFFGTTKPLYLPIKVGAVSSGVFFLSSLLLLIVYFLGHYGVLSFDVAPLALFTVISFVLFRHCRPPLLHRPSFHLSSQHFDQYA